MLKEDMYCFEPVIGYGMGEPPQEFLNGENRYPGDVETREAGRRYAEQFPRLKMGEYIGVLLPTALSGHAACVYGVVPAIEGEGKLTRSPVIHGLMGMDIGGAD